MCYSLLFLSKSWKSGDFPPACLSGVAPSSTSLCPPQHAGIFTPSSGELQSGTPDARMESPRHGTTYVCIWWDYPRCDDKSIRQPLHWDGIPSIKASLWRYQNHLTIPEAVKNPLQLRQHLHFSCNSLFPAAFCNIQFRGQCFSAWRCWV